MIFLKDLVLVLCSILKMLCRIPNFPGAESPISPGPIFILSPPIKSQLLKEDGKSSGDIYTINMHVLASRKTIARNKRTENYTVLKASTYGCRESERIVYGLSRATFGRLSSAGGGGLGIDGREGGERRVGIFRADREYNRKTRTRYRER